MFKKKMLIGLVFALGVSIPSAPVFADAVTPTSAIGAGTLRIDTFTVANFTGVTLSGVRQDVTSSASLKVTDATGSGNGWKVNLKASAVTSDASTNTGLLVLQPNSLVITAQSLAAETDSSGLTGVTLTTGAIDDHVSTPTGVNILSAAVNKGMGEYTLTISTLTITLLPKDAKAGSYSTTLTTTLSSGPVA